MPSQEECEEALYNPGKNNWVIDYVKSHNALTEIIQDLIIFNQPNKARSFFSNVYTKSKCKKWLFGHYHQDMDIDEKHTLVFDKIIKVYEGFNTQR